MAKTVGVVLSDRVTAALVDADAGKPHRIEGAPLLLPRV